MYATKVAQKYRYSATKLGAAKVATDSFKTDSKRTIQKPEEATGDLLETSVAGILAAL